MRSEQRGILCGLVFFVASIALLLVGIPLQISEKDGAEFGPEFFPKVITALTALVSLAFAIQQYLSLRTHGIKVFDNVRLSALKEFLPQVVFITIALVYLLIVEFVGFLLSSIVLVLVSLFYFGSKGKVKNVVISVVFSTAVYLVFSQILKISFPTGFLGF